MRDFFFMFYEFSCDFSDLVSLHILKRLIIDFCSAVHYSPVLSVQSHVKIKLIITIVITLESSRSILVIESIRSDKNRRDRLKFSSNKDF